MSSSQLKQPFRYEKIALDFNKARKEKRAKNTAGTIRRLSTYLATEKWKLLLVILMVLASSSLGLLGPYLVGMADRKSTRLNSSHVAISYAVFCLKKKIQKCMRRHSRSDISSEL